MIAITGIGVVSSFGTGKKRLLDGILKCASGLSESNASVYPISRIGEVRGFDPKEFLPPLKARRMSRFSLLALASAVEAVSDSALNLKEIDPFRLGVFVGTGLSSTESTDTFYGSLIEGGPLNQNPMLFPETVQNIAASHIAMHFGINGPNTTFSQNEISSELALQYGMSLLDEGGVDAVVVCGAEEISRALIRGFYSLRMLSRQGIMMPFDVLRDGFVPSEGAATLVLERFDDAKSRGARIYAVLASLGFSSSPVERLIYDAQGTSMKEAMMSALEKAGLGSPDVISAAANSSRMLDRAEAEAIEGIFGNKVPVTALRSYTGFFISDGVLRLAATALCMAEGFIPCILGLERPLSNRIDFICKEHRQSNLKSALINSFSSGGAAASTVIISPNI